MFVARYPTRVNLATVNPPESLNHFDVSADGNRFLISSRAESRAVPIVLVFDWTAGFASLIPSAP